MSTESQYQKYWLKLLDEGILTIQVPTGLVTTIKKAIIVRKYRHRQITGQKFNGLKISIEAATTTGGAVVLNKVRLTFKMHNLRTEDI